MCYQLGALMDKKYYSYNYIHIFNEKINLGSLYLG